MSLNKWIQNLRSTISRPVFRSNKQSCSGLHSWAHINDLLKAGEQDKLKAWADDQRIAPLRSLVRGNLVCRQCGKIAHYNLSLNIDNLISNLRAQRDNS